MYFESKGTSRPYMGNDRGLKATTRYYSDACYYIKEMELQLQKDSALQQMGRLLIQQMEDKNKKFKELYKNKEEKKMNYKVGDKVLLKNERCKYWNDKVEMDKYKGKVVTISKIELSGMYPCFEVKGEGRDIFGSFLPWCFSFDDIERKISDAKHFKTLPNDYTGTIEVNNGFIEEKEILDEKEREYLSQVIRPFRDKVSSISLIPYRDGSICYIEFYLKDIDYSSLPIFEKGTMYKGMEANKEYTLEELGL